ncbi:MAG: cellulase family glycosylhydrolase, partial [Ignavibacteriales bacterium]|nr:cellulase family glycosylhydrolase [Ignavibacteriales bacterium]
MYRQLLRPLTANFYHTQIGLCEDYPEETTTLEIIRKDMELLKRSGIGLLRISFGWDAIEEQKDKYSWLFWDDYVKMAVEEYGITLIPYICYTPSWNSTGDSTNFWNHTPKGYEEFGQFTFDLVTRYKKWIKSWELWNEPDIKEYWSGNVQDYARLAKIGSQAVRKADSTAIVVLGGLAHNTNFTRTLFRDLGISPFVDVVNMHNYNETWSGTPNELIIDYINTMADIVQTYGNGQSLWVA